jgi:hypothetical protein
MNGEEPLPGYRFNFIEAYNKLLLEEIKPIIMEAYPHAKGEEELCGMVFATLKVISHPVKERRKLTREIWAGSIL